MPNFNNNIDDYLNFKKAKKITGIEQSKDNPEQFEITFKVSDELGKVSEASQTVNLEYQKHLREMARKNSEQEILFGAKYDEFIKDLEAVIK